MTQINNNAQKLQPMQLLGKIGIRFTVDTESPCSPLNKLTGTSNSSRNSLLTQTDVRSVVKSVDSAHIRQKHVLLFGNGKMPLPRSSLALIRWPISILPSIHPSIACDSRAVLNDAGAWKMPLQYTFSHQSDERLDREQYHLAWPVVGCSFAKTGTSFAFCSSVNQFSHGDNARHRLTRHLYLSVLETLRQNLKFLRIAPNCASDGVGVYTRLVCFSLNIIYKLIQFFFCSR